MQEAPTMESIMQSIREADPMSYALKTPPEDFNSTSKTIACITLLVAGVWLALIVLSSLKLI